MVSRRSFLTGMAATAALLAARCGGSDEAGRPAVRQTVGPVKRGGTYRLASTYPALSIDPHTDVTMGLAYISYIYGCLLHEFQQPKGAPVVVFDHAESLENPDDLTYLFKMRPGVRFQDLPPANGREVLAEDVKYSFERIASVGSASFWTDGIAGMSAPDRATFEVDLTNAYAYAMGELGSVRSAIVPQEAVREFGDLKHNALGSGPFQVQSLSQGRGIDMVRNPNYYVEGIPYVDGISWRTYADDGSIQAAFKARQIDAYSPPSKIQADSIAGLGGVVLYREPNLTVSMINLNEIKAPVLQDVRVREALDISLDRDAMIDKLCFGEGNYTGPVSWGLEFWSLPQEELRQHYRRDVARARGLLEAAGVSGLTLELKSQSLPQVLDLAAMIKEQAAEAGITINIVSQELGAWISDMSANNFELLVGGHLPYPDESYPLQFNHTLNFSRKQAPVRLPEPEIDALLDEILLTTDIYERQKLVLEVTRKILDRHGPFLYLYAPYAYTARWDYVRGYEDIPPAMNGYTYDIWLDK